MDNIYYPTCTLCEDKKGARRSCVSSKKASYFLQISNIISTYQKLKLLLFIHAPGPAFGSEIKHHNWQLYCEVSMKKSQKKGIALHHPSTIPSSCHHLATLQSLKEKTHGSIVEKASLQLSNGWQWGPWDTWLTNLLTKDLCLKHNHKHKQYIWSDLLAVWKMTATN